MEGALLHPGVRETRLNDGPRPGSAWQRRTFFGARTAGLPTPLVPRPVVEESLPAEQVIWLSLSSRFDEETWRNCRRTATSHPVDEVDDAFRSVLTNGTRDGG